MPISQEGAAQIAAALNRKGVSNICPRCQNGPMLPVLEGFVTVTLVQSRADALNLGSPKQMAGCVCIGCQNCGFLTTHNLTVLGLGHLFPQ